MNSAHFLGPIPNACFVHRLIVMTISDLEISRSTWPPNLSRAIGGNRVINAQSHRESGGRIETHGCVDDLFAFRTEPPSGSLGTSLIYKASAQTTFIALRTMASRFCAVLQLRLAPRAAPQH
jgi:hypothetical protein